MSEATLYDFEEESGRSLRDYINILRRRKLSIAYTAAAVMLMAVLAAFLWPPTYKSESIILIEQQEIPAELVQSTITSYAQQRIEQIKARIMTIGNIMSIVDEYDLYTARERERKTRTEMAGEFRRAVSIKPISAEVVDPRSGRPSSAVIAFSLSYQGGAPASVQKVTNEITQLYLEENLKERREESISTSEFLENEAELLKSELGKLNEKIAIYKEENSGALPDQLVYNQSVIDRTLNQIDTLVFQLSELGKRKLSLESELTQLNPNAPVILSTGQAVLGEADRLKAMQTELRQLEAKYNENHPSVVRVKREVQELLDNDVSYAEREETLKQLRLERDRLSGLKQRYTDEHPKIVESEKIIRSLESALAKDAQLSDEKPDNPAYLVVQNRLDSTNEDIRATEQQLVELREKVERHERLLSKTPQVERDLQDMSRDYQSLNRKYQEIYAKQMSAELAKNLESEQRGERFTLIQPPELPIDPVSPNRVALVFLGAVLAIGAGFCMAVLREVLDDGVYGSQAVFAATGSMPLVTISYMENRDEKRKHLRSRIYWLLGLVLLGVISLILFHFFIKPLDVTWFILMRRLGL